VRVLVCGGRDYSNYWQVDSVLSDLWEHKAGRQLHVIHGGARGADSLAAEFVSRAHPLDNITGTAYPADWRRYGKGAGAIRNQKMLDEAKPDLVVAFPGGPGTADMVKRARAGGVEVREVP
jgi:hypothetical protein